MSRQKLYLVDAMSYVFRAFYAVKGNLTNLEGFPTNAIYGFKNMILGLLDKNKAQYLAIVFDSGSKTFRNDIYSLYKANRDQAPDDLKIQFEPIFELVKILKLPIIKKENWEADDLIAELSRSFVNEVDELVIVSGDKDLTQLVTDKVSIFDEMKNLKIRKDEVKKKYGVYPEQIAEYLALTGDSSDNIPGAAGIGPKTAAALLKEHQTIASIFENLDKLKPTVRSKIENSKDNIELSLKLTTLSHKISLDYSLDSFKVKPPEQQLLVDFYTKYNFSSDNLVTITKTNSTPKKSIQPSDYQIIDKPEILQQYLKKIKSTGLFAFDLETTSLTIQDAEIVGIAVAVADLPAGYIPLTHKTSQTQLNFDDCLNEFEMIFKQPQIRLIAHNLKYEISVLKKYTIELKNQLEDTMLQSYLINPESNQHSLDKLANNYFNYTTISFEEVAGKGKEQLRFDKIEIAKALPYAAEDAAVTLKLYHHFAPKIKELHLEKLYYKIELPLVAILSKIESLGVKIDATILVALSHKMKQQVQTLSQEIYQEVGVEFNINSPKQLGEILFDKMNIQEFKKKTKTGYSTDANTLAKLAKQYPVANKIYNYRIKQKLINTYLDVLPTLVHPKSNRIHTSFRQTIAATGRLSSNDPNLQNIPIRGEEGSKVRESFIAEKGYKLISADYSQIELRLLAHFCKDENLIAAFREDKDIHRETAVAIFQTTQEKVDSEMRSVAKAINFGLLYGMGAFKLSQEINSSRQEAQIFIDTYFSQFPKIQQFIEKVKEETRKTEIVTTLFGRRRSMKGINDKNAMVRASMERIAVNTIIQGSAADIIKLAMIHIANHYYSLKKEHQMILQIHDELVFEVLEQETSERMKIIKQKMEQVTDLNVILKVDIKKGDNWNQVH